MASAKIAMAFLLCLLASGCHSTSESTGMKPYEPYLLMERESVTVPLVYGSNLQWLVKATVNGRQGLFILDTGATSTIITPQFARQLGLTNAAEIRTTTIKETGQNIENVPLQSF